VNHVNFTHDINPGNGPAVSPVDSGNGFGTRVFWTAVIPDRDVQVNPLTGAARLHVQNLPELDYYSPAGQGDLASLGPTWQTGYFDAAVSIDVVWSGPVTRRVNVRDAANGFAGIFNENQATVTWSAKSQSGFRFTSNPGNFSTSVPEVPGVNGVSAPLNFFAQVGLEANGIFFPSDSAAGGGQPSDRPSLESARPGPQTRGIASSPSATGGSTAGMAGSKSALPGRTALDAVALVGALGDWSTAPAAAAAARPPLPPPPARRADARAAAPVGAGQPRQPAPAPDWGASRAAHGRAVDPLFAGLDGGTLADALRGGGSLARDGWGHGRTEAMDG
jgi:hypothetical protein